MRFKLVFAIVAASLAVAVSGASVSTATSCISGTVSKVKVAYGQSVCITAGAVVGAVVVQQGGILDVEGGSIGNFSSDGAASITINDASVSDSNAVIENSLGPVSIDSSSFAGVTLDGNRVGVTLTGSSASSVKITNTLSAVTATGNTVMGDMTVRLDTQGVTVTGNGVGGTLTVQLCYGVVVDSRNTAGVLNVQ